MPGAANNINSKTIYGRDDKIDKLEAENTKLKSRINSLELQVAFNKKENFPQRLEDRSKIDELEEDKTALRIMFLQCAEDFANVMGTLHRNDYLRNRLAFYDEQVKELEG